MLNADFDIDENLYKIVHEYGLDKWYPEWGIYYQAKELIKDLFLSIPDDTQLAIRGGGNHTKELLKILCKENLAYKVNYIVDAQVTEKEIEGIEVISVNEAKNKKIEKYIISSFRFCREMAAAIRRDNTQVDVVELYNYFRKNGLCLTTDFYKNTCPYLLYSDIYFSLENLKKANSEEERKVSLEQAIFQCIEIRDFLSAFKYIEDYIRYGFDEANKYSQAAEAIKELLNKIKYRLGQKKQKNIIINWIDCVPYEESQDMEYLQEIIKDSLCFDSAFSVCAKTHGTLLNMFRSEMVQEGHAREFYGEKLTEQNSPLLQELKKNGYLFRYVAYPYLYSYLFDESQILNKSNPGCTAYYEDCSTRLQWLVIKDYLENDQKICYLIHNLAETHPYYVSPEVLGFTLKEVESRNTEKTISKKYLDKQLRFYGAFYSKQTIQIFLSDHGYGQGYIDKKHRVIMTIKGENLKKGHEKKLYSHLNFCHLLKWILHPSETNYEKIFGEFVIYQHIDIYNPTFAQKVFEEIEQKRIMGKMDDKSMSSYFQYVAVRGKDHLFVKYFHGKELFFFLPDTENNVINNEAYREIISEYRSLVENKMIDWKKDNFFEACERLYEFVPHISEQAW